VYETHFCVCKTDELDIPIRCTHMRGVTHSSSTRARTSKCSTSEALYVSDSDREARRQGGQNRFVDGPDRRGARCCVTRCRSLVAIRSIRTSATRDHKSHGSLTEMRATGNKSRVRQTQAHAHAWPTHTGACQRCVSMCNAVHTCLHRRGTDTHLSNSAFFKSAPSQVVRAGGAGFGVVVVDLRW